ncbi:MAG: hypothetical protein WC816_11005 [Sphingomonas sp.]|jgi:hypothetical protein
MPHPDPLSPRRLPRPRADVLSMRPPFSPRLVDLRLAPGLRLILSSVVGRRSGKRGPGKPEGEACPVKPDRPLNLSGGAAEALEFDE